MAKLSALHTGELLARTGNISCVKMCSKSLWSNVKTFKKFKLLALAFKVVQV